MTDDTANMAVTSSCICVGHSSCPVIYCFSTTGDKSLPVAARSLIAVSMD